MKNQYFADRRDLIKYELLLDLVERDGLPKSLLSLIMLTPNDETKEGSVRNYKQENYRPALFKFLNECSLTKSRDVSLLRELMLSMGVDYRPMHDDRCIDDSCRSHYFELCATAAHNHSLIFFDPDIGLQTGSTSYMKRKGATKYLLYEELSLVAHSAPTNAVIIVYQHLQNDKSKVRNDLHLKSLDFCKFVGSKSASIVTDLDVAYLVTSRNDESSRWASKIVCENCKRHGLEFIQVPLEPNLV